MQPSPSAISFRRRLPQRLESEKGQRTNASAAQELEHPEALAGAL